MSQYPIKAHELKLGYHVLLSEKTYKIIELTTSKTGKHGHMKVCITGIHIFSGQKKMEIYPGHFMLTKVEPTQTEYQLLFLDKANQSVQLLNSENETVELSTSQEPESNLTTLEALLKEDCTVSVIVTTVPEGSQITRIKRM